MLHVPEHAGDAASTCLDRTQGRSLGARERHISRSQHIEEQFRTTTLMIDGKTGPWRRETELRPFRIPPRADSNTADRSWAPRIFQCPHTNIEGPPQGVHRRRTRGMLSLSPRRHLPPIRGDAHHRPAFRISYHTVVNNRLNGRPPILVSGFLKLSHGETTVEPHCLTCRMW